MPRPKHTDRQVRAQLARRIQEARVERGWTREQLAEALGLQAVQMVWKYETGRLSISATMLYRLAGALGCRWSCCSAAPAPASLRRRWWRHGGGLMRRSRR